MRASSLRRCTRRPAAALAGDRRGPVRALQTHELYQLALGFRPSEEGWTDAVVAEIGGWTAYDAIVDPQLARELVGLMRRRQR